MRIIQVSDCYLPLMGGIETHVSRLSRALESHGHSVAVLTATPVDPSRGIESPWESRSEAARWVGRHIDQASASGTVRSEWKNPLALPIDPRAARRFAELIDKSRPDVVHMHMGELTPVVMGLMRRMRGAGIPTLISVHSVWQQIPTVLGYRAWARLNGVRTAPYLWAPVSELVAGRVRQVIPAERVTPLANGIDPDGWRRTPAEHEGLVAVAATRFAPRKRVPELLAVLRAVGEKLGQNGVPGTPGLRVVLAGEGPGLDSAVRYIKRNGMDSWVRLPGRLDSQQLAELYRASDVYLAPGVDDAFSVSGLEARVAGLAILSRSQSGFGADLEDGIEGRAARSDAEMAQVLTEWARNPGVVKTMKRHNLVSDYRHSWDRVVPATIDLYDRAATLQ